MVAMIGDLYRVEKIATAMEMSDQERRWLRKKKSKPILKKIYRWLHYRQPKVVPKSPLGQAIAYALNNWRALITFLEAGKLEIDNNRSERAYSHEIAQRFLFYSRTDSYSKPAVILIQIAH